MSNNIEKNEVDIAEESECEIEESLEKPEVKMTVDECLQGINSLIDMGYVVLPSIQGNPGEYMHRKFEKDTETPGDTLKALKNKHLEYSIKPCDNLIIIDVDYTFDELMNNTIQKPEQQDSAMNLALSIYISCVMRTYKCNIVKSPSGHFHFYFKINPESKLKIGKIGKVEFKRHGACITTPYSIYTRDTHPENYGKQYIPDTFYKPNDLTDIEDFYINSGTVKFLEGVDEYASLGKTVLNRELIFGQSYHIECDSTVLDGVFTKELFVKCIEYLTPKDFTYPNLIALICTIAFIGRDNNCENEAQELVHKRLSQLEGYKKDKIDVEVWPKCMYRPPQMFMFIIHAIAHGLNLNDLKESKFEVANIFVLEQKKGIILEENSNYPDANSWTDTVKRVMIGNKKKITNIDEVKMFLIHNVAFVVSAEAIYIRYKETENKDWLVPFSIESFKKIFGSDTFEILNDFKPCKYGRFICDKNEEMTDEIGSFLNLYKPFHLYWNEEKYAKLYEAGNEAKLEAYRKKSEHFIQLFNELMSRLFEKNTGWMQNALAGIMTGEKIGVNIVLSSVNEGPGKGTFCKAIMGMLKGRSKFFNQYKGRNGLFEKTFSLVNKNLVVLDEIGKGSISDADYETFKSLTTDDTFSASPLYGESIQAPNSCNFIINCNHIEYLKISPGSRRFCVNKITAGEMEANLATHWHEEVISDPDFAYIMWHYITKNWKYNRAELKNFSGESKEFLSMQMINSLEAPQRFILEVKYPEAIAKMNANNELKTIETKNTELFAEFKRWKQRDATDGTTSQGFGKSINPFFEASMTLCNNHNRIFDVMKLTDLIKGKKMNPQYFIDMAKDDNQSKKATSEEIGRTANAILYKKLNAEKLAQILIERNIDLASIMNDTDDF